MLEFKGQAPNRTMTEQPVLRRGDWFAEFDFLRILTDFFCAAAWSTERMELRPVPVKVRDRR